MVVWTSGHQAWPLTSNRLSEQRIHDLLDGLCTAASADATLYTVKDVEKYKLVWSDKKDDKSWIEPDKAEREGVCITYYSVVLHA